MLRLYHDNLNSGMGKEAAARSVSTQYSMGSVTSFERWDHERESNVPKVDRREMPQEFDDDVQRRMLTEIITREVKIEEDGAAVKASSHHPVGWCECYVSRPVRNTSSYYPTPRA